MVIRVTPASVIEAGQRERERWEIRVHSRLFEKYVVAHSSVGVNPDNLPTREVFRGTRADCHAFISDRVFQAQLRAALEHCEVRTASPVRFRTMMNELAEDDHG